MRNRLIPALALLVALTGPALAQRGRPGNGPGPDRPGMGRREGLSRRLGLTEEQKQQMLQIRQRYRGNPDKRPMWREMRGVLTPQQMQQLRQIRRQRRMQRQDDGE